MIGPNIESPIRSEEMKLIPNKVNFQLKGKWLAFVSFIYPEQTHTQKSNKPLFAFFLMKFFKVSETSSLLNLYFSSWFWKVKGGTRDAVLDALNPVCFANSFRFGPCWAEESACFEVEEQAMKQKNNKKTRRKEQWKRPSWKVVISCPPIQRHRR